MLLRHDDEGVNGDAHDDRRHTVENIGGEPDHVGQTPVAAKLRDIDTAGNANRHPHETGDCQQDARPKDGIRHPASHLTHRFGDLSKKSEIERGGAFVDEITENGDQRRHHQDGAAHGGRGRQMIGEYSPNPVGSPGAQW